MLIEAAERQLLVDQLELGRTQLGHPQHTSSLPQSSRRTVAPRAGLHCGRERRPAARVVTSLSDGRGRVADQTPNSFRLMLSADATG